MRDDIRAHAVPTVEQEPEEPPPFVVLVQGPPQVGSLKTVLPAYIPHTFWETRCLACGSDSHSTAEFKVAAEATCSRDQELCPSTWRSTEWANRA